MQFFYGAVIRCLMRNWPVFTRKLVFKGVALACRRQFKTEQQQAQKQSENSGATALEPDPVQVLGMSFPGAIGIAAGFDRSGHIGRRIKALGFGFMEIGTLTPDGAEGRNLALLSTLERQSSDICGGRLGVNIGRRNQGSLLQGIDDYVQGLRSAWPVADYIALNFSGPPGRAYLEAENAQLLERLLHSIKASRWRLSEQSGRWVPIVIKLKMSSDLKSLLPALSLIKEMQFEGIIAAEDGGKSAQRLTSLVKEERAEHQQQVCDRIALLKYQLGTKVAIISVGAIANIEEAEMRIDAGASLVQVHNALIYRGPWFLKELKCYNGTITSGRTMCLSR